MTIKGLFSFSYKQHHIYIYTAKYPLKSFPSRTELTLLWRNAVKTFIKNSPLRDAKSPNSQKRCRRRTWPLCPQQQLQLLSNMCRTPAVGVMKLLPAESHGSQDRKCGSHFQLESKRLKAEDLYLEDLRQSWGELQLKPHSKLKYSEELLLLKELQELKLRGKLTNLCHCVLNKFMLHLLYLVTFVLFSLWEYNAQQFNNWFGLWTFVQ